MEGVVRKNDWCTGHGCFPPRQPATWAKDILIDNQNIVRRFDMWQIHCCPGGGCHIGFSNGKHTTKVNNRDIQIQFDPITCGSYALTGSGSGGLN